MMENMIKDGKWNLGLENVEILMVWFSLETGSFLKEYVYPNHG